MRIFILILCLLIALPFHANGQDHDTVISKVEQWFQALDAAQSKFTQINPDGSQLTGIFYLDRPGKLRFDYDQNDDFVVADGVFIYYYDAALKQQSNMPLGQSLADFILRDDLLLKDHKDIKITNIRDNGTLWLMDMTQRSDPYGGTITLGFQHDPFRLYRWRVTDATGAITEITLNTLDTAPDLDRSLFIYRDPDTSLNYYND